MDQKSLTINRQMVVNFKISARSEVSTLLITLKLTYQNALKALFTFVVYSNARYYSPHILS